MTKLVDTSVWSLSLRRRTTAFLKPEEQRQANLLIDALSQGSVAIIGPIRQELLSGIKETAQYEKVKNCLREFRDTPLETGDYEEAARLYNLCRGRGIQSGAVDILICAVALRRHWEILSLDCDLERCLNAVKSHSVKSGKQ
jgi:predicted nucleic acid-binding protein